MNNSTAIRLARQCERHIEKAVWTAQRIRDEHPKGKAIYDALEDEQLMMLTGIERVVREVLELEVPDE